MFNFVRNHQKLFQILLGLLIIPSFVAFGIQGYSRFSEASAAKVASVDGQAITQGEWDQAHQRRVENLRRQMPTVDVKLFDSPEMRRESLDALVRERVLLKAAQDKHLFPGDERLQRLFRNDPQMAGIRNPDGTVNRDLLASQGMTSEGFAAQLRQDFGQRQVLAATNASAMLPKASVTSALDAWLQRREIQVEVFDAKAYASKVSPTDADLERHYQAQAQSLRRPEQARIEYVVLDLPSLTKGVSVPEEDIRKYYEENASTYTSAEERRASHILIKADKEAPAAERQKAQQRARELLAEVRKAPASFADLARKHSQDPGSAAKGGDLDFFGKGAMVKPFEAAAFAMKTGEISEVVETDFGFHILQLTGVRGGVRKPFESVRAEIEGLVKRQLAQKKFAEAAEQFTNTVYEQSDSLQPVIDKLKLDKQTAIVQRAPAPGATGPLGSAKLLEAVFSNDVLRNKRNTDAVDLGGSQLVSARLLEHTPATVPPLAEIRDKVKAAVVSEQAAALARKDGETKLAQVKATPGQTLPRTVVVARNQTQQLPRQVVDAALRAGSDALPAALGVDLRDQGYAVVRVIKVVPRDDTAGDAAMAAPVTQAWAAAESAAYLEALKRRYKTQVDGTVKVADAAAAAASR